MVVVDRKFGGAAAKARLLTTMSATVPGAGGTIDVDDDSGYPTTGKFEIVVDRGENNEENLLINSRSGATFTIGQRAYDGSVASAHTSGVAFVEHDLSGRTVQLFVDHVDDVEAAPHSTKLPVGTTAGHDVEARHTFGAALGTPVTPTALTPDIAGNAGTGNNPSREDHVHNVPAAVPVAVGTALAEGAGTSFARDNHVHVVGVGAINAANMFAAGVVDAAAIGTDAVGTDEIAANAVSASEIAADAVGSSELSITAIIPTVTVFTGSGTWTKPAKCRWVRVRVVGGGGSGGGCAATAAGQGSNAGGGGGGGYAEEVIPAASLGATVTVTVGAGGAAATAGANPGNAGGTSSFGSHCSATGGAAGAGSGTTANYAAGAAGGAGGTGSGGDINMSGGRGGEGTIASGGEPIPIGNGGESIMSASARGAVNSVGEAGKDYGGGSSGACSAPSQAARTSTAGAAGIVIVEEFA